MSASVEQAKFVRGRIPFRVLTSAKFNEFMNRLLNKKAVYLGATHLVSKPGTFLVSPSTNGAHLVVRDGKGTLRAFLNVCRHREKQIFIPSPDWSSGYTGKLPGGMITCNAHSWVYFDDGTHQASPAFGVHCDMSQGLHEVAVTEIGGALWLGDKPELEAVHEMLNLSLMKELGVTTFIPENYRLHPTQGIWIDNARYTPATAMEVYGDVTHVAGGNVHAETLMCAVDPAGLVIDCPKKSGSVSVQMVPWLASCGQKRTNEHWFRYHELAKEYGKDDPGDKSGNKVLWLAHYPDGTTIEIFPYMVVVSRFAPDLAGGTRNIVEFYFPEEVLAFYPELANSGIAAYKRLAGEDGKLCVELDNGRRHLATFGLGNEVGGWIHPHEEGVVEHYFTWLEEQWTSDNMSNGEML